VVQPKEVLRRFYTLDSTRLIGETSVAFRFDSNGRPLALTLPTRLTCGAALLFVDFSAGGGTLIERRKRRRERERERERERGRIPERRQKEKSPKKQLVDTKMFRLSGPFFPCLFNPR
jgi:hypothetical protein